MNVRLDLDPTKWRRESRVIVSWTPAQARDRLTKLRLARAFIVAAGLLLVFAMVWR